MPSSTTTIMITNTITITTTIMTTITTTARLPRARPVSW